MTDYLAVKEADAALGIEDPADAAAALNAQTETVTVAVQTNDMREVLWPPLEYAELVLLSQERDFDVTPRDTVKQAITARSVLDSGGSIAADDATQWDQVTADLRELGVVSTASTDALAALRTAAAPVWQPALTSGDIQTAREQP